MSRYELFQMLLDFVAENYKVTDADMKNYSDEIEISGEIEGQKIKITVELEEVVEE